MKPKKRKKWLWIVLMVAGLWSIGIIQMLVEKPKSPPPQPVQIQETETVTEPAKPKVPKPKALPPRMPVPLEKQFSARDGSHFNTVRYIKRLMHNPKSFEHVATRHYIDPKNKDNRIIHTTYRGTNTFNALILNTTTVRTDLDGNVIGVVKTKD